MTGCDHLPVYAKYSISAKDLKYDQLMLKFVERNTSKKGTIITFPRRNQKMLTMAKEHNIPKGSQEHFFPINKESKKDDLTKTVPVFEHSDEKESEFYQNSRNSLFGNNNSDVSKSGFKRTESGNTGINLFGSSGGNLNTEEKEPDNNGNVKRPTV